MHEYISHTKIERYYRSFLKLCKPPEGGLLALMSVRDGSDHELYTMEDFERVLNKENFYDEYSAGVVTPDNKVYSPYMLDQFDTQQLGIYVYDEGGNLLDDINVDDALGYADEMSWNLDYVYYAKDNGEAGLYRITTGALVTNKTFTNLHSGWAIAENYGIICQKIVDATTYLTLIDFNLNVVWEQLMEPHPQIANSNAVRCLRVSKSGEYFFAAVHIGNNDITMAKFQTSDGSLVGQVNIDTKISGGEPEAIWLDENDTIYVASRISDANGENWEVEVINSDMTIYKKLYMPDRTFDNYGSGNPFVITGHSIEHLIDNKVLFAGYYSGTSPSAGFWAYYDVTTDEINVLDDHIYEYQFLDEIEISGGRPHQRSQ